MGNMVPCLVQGSSSILPPMKTKHWSRSMKLPVISTLRRSTRRSHGSNRVKPPASSSRETSSAADQATPRARRSLIRSSPNRRAVRVKVVLTRAEAAELLSLTAHGHRTAADVMGQLIKRRQATGGSKASTAQVISELKRMAWRPVLESIPEE